MQVLPLRLKPGDDLRAAIQAAAAGRPDAAFVIAGIGSLSAAAIRFAGASVAESVHGDLEILTLSGSISGAGGHLHLSVADAAGRVRGGHAASGCIVRTTAEVLLAWLPGWRFDREFDPDTGYAELVVRQSRATA